MYIVFKKISIIYIFYLNHVCSEAILTCLYVNTFIKIRQQIITLCPNLDKRNDASPFNIK